MAKSLMIQGTGSGVGKSLIVSGLCRIFSDMGIKVAPFKAQNMALNSFITKEGREIGRAQALQAEASRIEPSVDMNPVLLKASGETGCQVILNGRVHSNMKAHEYYEFKKEAWNAVTKAYERLSEKYDLIVIEGAGSPAEINLSKDEVVNMRVARHTDSPVILVGDIDKGGVFASFYGTIGLLDRDADYIKAFIINKFRGDLNILKPGIDMIKEKTGRPVLGVIPYLGDMGLHEEDGIPLERLKSSECQSIKDLLFLRDHGIEKSIKRAVEKGINLAGICGGYQMLGRKIYDPYSMESEHKDVDGIGLLDISTTLEAVKTTCQVEAEVSGEWINGLMGASHKKLKGYEIHMGNSTGSIGLFRLKRFSDSPIHPLTDSPVLDGSQKGNVWGTYIHGIFDNDNFRRNLINSMRIKKGLVPIEEMIDYSKLRDDSLDSWAGIIRENIDIKFIEGLING